MITLEEALNGLAQFIIINDTGTDESASAIEWHNIINQYIIQQQAKEERAKKEHELLGLYHSKDMHMEDYYAYGSLRGSQKALDNLRSVREEIEVLEKELEELK